MHCHCALSASLLLLHKMFVLSQWSFFDTWLCWTFYCLPLDRGLWTWGEIDFLDSGMKYWSNEFFGLILMSQVKMSHSKDVRYQSVHKTCRLEAVEDPDWEHHSFSLSSRVLPSGNICGHNWRGPQHLLQPAPHTASPTYTTNAHTAVDLLLL